MKAMFFTDIDGKLQCKLCPRNCIIPLNKMGFCNVRKNENNNLVSLVYGKPSSISIDPIEKKPLFHFAPGSQTLSVATVGCTFTCKYCQNWDISQSKNISGKDVKPEELADLARSTDGISWTYTEPTVFYEYFYNTAKIMKNNLYNVWVTNGFTNEEPIKKASKFIDAVNVDYKGDNEFYRKLCSAGLEPVQSALKLYKKLGVWIEVTNLIIPGFNDKEKQIREMVEWIHDNLGQVPLHISRFFPHHELEAPPTPLKTIENAVRIAEKYLDYVYVGNISHPKESTICHNCNEILIKRSGFSIGEINLRKKGKDYHCPECSTKIPLAGMKWAKN